MALLSWGKPIIAVAKWNGSTTPASFRKLMTPKEDSTNLDTSEGDKMEAKYEGGSMADMKYKRSTYELTADFFIMKGKKKPFGDMDGVVDGEYYIYVQPEDASAYGLRMQKCTVSVTTKFTSADGITQTVKFSSLQPDDSNTEEQLEIGVITFAEGTGGALTATFTEIGDDEHPTA